MTEQEIREKVINGILCNLNFTTKSDCEQCGYNCEKTMFLSVPVDLLADTLALLKLQEYVPVVRCKNCKHRDPEDKWCDCGGMEGLILPRQDDWYCANGERRGDNG